MFKLSAFSVTTYNLNSMCFLLQVVNAQGGLVYFHLLPVAAAPGCGRFWGSCWDRWGEENAFTPKAGLNTSLCQGYSK